MEQLLPVVEGLWAADVGSVAVADSCKKEKEAWYGTKLTRRFFPYSIYTM